MQCDRCFNEYVTSNSIYCTHCGYPNYVLWIFSKDEKKIKYKYIDNKIIFFNNNIKIAEMYTDKYINLENEGEFNEYLTIHINNDDKIIYEEYEDYMDIHVPPYLDLEEPRNNYYILTPK